MNGTLLTMDQAYSKYLKALLWMFLATIGGMALGNIMPGIYLIAAIASLVLCIVMAFSKGTTKFVTVAPSAVSNPIIPFGADAKPLAFSSSACGA